MSIMEPAVQHARINGTELAYVEQGEGEPVVFVHGGICDLRSWNAQMDAVGSEFRAVALSCRHYYPNDAIRDGAELRLETLADDLGAFLRTLDLAPAHLVGNSSGAFVCLLLARSDPDLVRTLVLGEPPAMSILGVSVPPTPLELLRLLVRSPTTAFHVIRFGAGGLGPALKAFAKNDDRKGLKTFVRTALGPSAAAAVSEARYQQMEDNVLALKAQLRSGLPRFSLEDARRVHIPTLFVTGENTAPLHLRITDELERAMPQTERLDIRNASHLMSEDRADTFNGAVLDFLSRPAA